MRSKVQERTQKGKAAKEKENFKTSWIGYLHCALGDISQHHQCIFPGRSLFPSLLKEREKYLQYSEIVVSLSTFPNNKFSIDVCPVLAVEEYFMVSLLQTSFLQKLETQSLEMEQYKQESLEAFQILHSQKLLFCCYVNACHSSTVSIVFIILAFRVLHSHSSYKRRCIKQTKRLRCFGKFYAAYKKEIKRAIHLL